MNLIIYLFAFFIVMAGIVLMLRPAVLMDFLESNSDKTWIYASAIAVRALLGWILIQQSTLSRFPLVIEVLGWLMILAALFLLLLGHSRFMSLVRWLTSKLGHLSRLAGVFALVFGAFLVYAFFQGNSQNIYPAPASLYMPGALMKNSSCSSVGKPSSSGGESSTPWEITGVSPLSSTYHNCRICWPLSGSVSK